MAENLDLQPVDGLNGAAGHASPVADPRPVGKNRSQRAAGAGNADTGHRPRPGRDGTDGVPGAIQLPELGSLLPSASQELARTVTIDEDFAKAYPRLWTVLSCQRTVKGKPRCPAEIVVKADGAVFVAMITCPEEMLVLGAEFELVGDLWSALEARLTQEPIPWRKAGKHVRRKQLSPEKGGGQNQG